MARIDEEVRIQLSVLDRLIDYEPDVRVEPPASRAKSLRQLKQALRRDLEWLLNTRCTGPLPEEPSILVGSLLSYGLPDFSTMSVRNTEDQGELIRVLETTLRRFEPRLESVVVSLAASSPFERALRFRIEARLRIDPMPEPVTFDTMFVLGSGTFAVKGE